MTNIKRKVMKANKMYVLVFDEYDTLYTVTLIQNGQPDVACNSSNAAVKFFVNNQDKIVRRDDVNGLKYL